MQLPDGLYDKLVTETVAQLIAGLRDPSCRTLSSLPPEEVSERVTEALAKQLTLLLDELDGDGAEKAKRQIALVNTLLVHLKQHTATGGVDPLVEPPQILRAIHNSGSAPEVPETGLAIPWLFTAGKGSPSLLTELRREIACCDQVDILVSFITVSGVRKLFDILQTATAVGTAGRPRTRLGFLTTTYTGATEMEALDYLARLPGWPATAGV
jgi:ribosomal protein L29